MEQSGWQRAVLYANLALIVAVAVFFYVFFSINPFTREEVDRLREEALAKIGVAGAHP